MRLSIDTYTGYFVYYRAVPILINANFREKYMQIVKLFFLLMISVQSLGQDTLWKKRVINEFLTFNIPAKFNYEESSYVKAIGGQVNSNFYGFQYYDTVFLQVKNEEDFGIALTGFMSGRTEDPSLKKYDVAVFDTILNGTKGLMARFTTTDKSEDYKQIYYYVTMANNRFYWFYVYMPLPKATDEGLRFYFNSIRFNNEKLKEKSYRLAPTFLTKKVE